MTAKEFFDLTYRQSLEKAELFVQKFPNWYNYLETLSVIPWNQNYIENSKVLPKRIEIDIQNIGERVDKKFLESLESIFLPENGAVYFPKTQSIAFVNKKPSFLLFLSETGKLFFSARDEVWYLEHGGAMLLVLLILNGHLNLTDNENAVFRFLDYLHAASSKSLTQQEVDSLELKISSCLDKSLGLTFETFLLVGLQDITEFGGMLDEYTKEKFELNDFSINQMALLTFLKLTMILAPKSKVWKDFLFKLLTEEPVSVKQEEEPF